MSNDLLDEFTQVLAYVGDAQAKDGYGPELAQREEPLSDATIDELIEKTKALLQTGKAIVDLPADILCKINYLKQLYDNSTINEKQELLDYLNTYESQPMH
jgi:hypothetical protein